MKPKERAGLGVVGIWVFFVVVVWIKDTNYTSLLMYKFRLESSSVGLIRNH